MDDFARLTLHWVPWAPGCFNLRATNAQPGSRMIQVIDDFTKMVTKNLSLAIWIKWIANHDLTIWNRICLHNQCRNVARHRKDYPSRPWLSPLKSSCQWRRDSPYHPRIPTTSDNLSDLLQGRISEISSWGESQPMMIDFTHLQM